MFSKKEIELNFDLIIGENAVIHGDMESEGSIRIDGKIFGNIQSHGNVIISDAAIVTGNISCLNTEIYGTCHGDVNVKGKINLHENASLDGDVYAKSFSTKEGAHFRGQCHVNTNEGNAPIQHIDDKKLIALSNKENDGNGANGASGASGANGALIQDGSTSLEGKNKKSNNA